MADGQAFIDHEVDVSPFSKGFYDFFAITSLRASISTSHADSRSFDGNFV